MIWPILFFAFIVFSALWSMKNPGIAIGLLICMYGIESFLQTRSAYFIDHKTSVNIAIGVVLLVASIASILRLPFKPRHIDAVQVITLLLFAFGFLSYYWTLDPQQFHRWRGCLPYVGVFLILAPILTREENVLKSGFQWTMIIGIPLMFLTAFYCEWGVRGMVLARPIIENNRIINETLPLAIATLASTLGIIALVTHVKIPAPLLFRMAILGVAIYLAFLTRSRGQVVAIIGVAAIIYPISNRATNVKGFFITMLGITIFSVIVFTIINNLDLMRWRQEHVESAMYGRQDMWGNLLTYWLREPGLSTLIGLGVCSSFKIVGFYPHNLPIEILVELGLVGFALYATVLTKSFLSSLDLLSKLDDYPQIRADVIAVIGLIGVTFALSLKEGSLYIWPPFFFYAICLSQQVRLTTLATNAIKRKKWMQSLFMQNQAMGREQR